MEFCGSVNSIFIIQCLSIIMCIYTSNYFGFQCSNWKKRSRDLEYLRISRGGGGGGGVIVQGDFIRRVIIEPKR